MASTNENFALSELEAQCPVSLDVLGQLYRAKPETVAEMLRGMSEDKRIRLALYCYQRAHLRDLSLVIVEACDARRLAELAGTLGQVLAAQCRAKIKDFGLEPIRFGGGGEAEGDAGSHVELTSLCRQWFAQKVFL